MLMAWTVMLGEDKSLPLPSQSSNLMGVVAPLYTALAFVGVTSTEHFGPGESSNLRTTSADASLVTCTTASDKTLPVP